VRIALGIPHALSTELMQQGVTAQLDSLARLYLIPIGWRLAGAAAIWLIGSWAIRLLRAAFKQSMRVRQVDITLATYLDTGAAAVLQLLVLIAVLGVLGVETTSFAALLAAAGIAIGAAWSGLLANFAAGLFLLTFRPFKVGDMIAAGGITGMVREIGLFATAIDTADHVRTYVGNNKLFSDNVQNFSANAFRRVDLTAQLAPAADLDGTIVRLRDALVTIPNVLKHPAPHVEILSIAPAGPVLAVRPYCHNDHYWQVYFDTNRLISKTMSPDQPIRRVGSSGVR
jgi:small conductance mechanosensitive channel